MSDFDKLNPPIETPKEVNEVKKPIDPNYKPKAGLYLAMTACALLVFNLFIRLHPLILVGICALTALVTFIENRKYKKPSIGISILWLINATMWIVFFIAKTLKH